jgi:Predicted transcriptional regulators
MAGLSSLVLLAVLARAGREMYGYEIAKAVKAEGEGGLIFKQGAIYPVLRSLNATGLLQSRVEASAFGRPGATTTSPRTVAKRSPSGNSPGATCASLSTMP